jgi:hypothetical protein
MAKNTLMAAALAAVASITGCGSGPTSPTNMAVVTFAVGGETFRVEVAGREQIAAARAAQASGATIIPNGRIALGTGVNRGWTWHLDEVEFPEVAIELCDGRPSDVERDGLRFGGGRFCPWGARVLMISTR